jgi:small-conductance mechanosensitive channel
MMNLLQEWFVFGIAMDIWLRAAVLATLSYVVMELLIRFVTQRMSALARHTNKRFGYILADALGATKHTLITLIAILIGLHMVDLPAKLELWLSQANVILIGLQLIFWLNRGINAWVDRLGGEDGKPELRNRATTTTMVFLLRLAVLLTIVLAVLANLGVNITAFIASLGIGGIAIALALQNILSDLFASLSIGLDKPFEIGDFIVVDNMQGNVEYVGVKTTRLRSLSGEQIVRSNAELLKSVIRNYKSLQERRIVFGFGILYETPIAQIPQVVQAVRDIISQIPDTRLDRAHFAKLGNCSLDFEVVYYVLNPDYALYMDIQQRINLELMQFCETQKIGFAYPTTTLHVASELQMSVHRRQHNADGQSPDPTT